MPFFLNFNPFLLNALQNPLITTGTTIGLVLLMINAVPFLPGAKGFVVPCGKVITQLLSNDLSIFLVSDGSRPFLFTLLSGFHVLFTVIAPARVKNRLIRLPRMVSSAATLSALVNGFNRYQGIPSRSFFPHFTAQKICRNVITSAKYVWWLLTKRTFRFGSSLICSVPVIFSLFTMVRPG